MSNYKNLASTVLENSGQTTDTSITMPSTTAALFPTPPFYATIMPTNSGLANGSNSEIVEVTAATTSGANTIFSISRAQRGTSAISWDANEAILSHAIYTQDMPFIDDVLSTPSSVAYVATDNIQTSAVTTPKIADGAVTSDKIDWATLSCATLFASDTAASLTQNSYTTVPFDPTKNANVGGKSFIRGNLSYDSTDKCIVIGSGISTVEVSASCAVQNIASGVNIWAVLTLNDTTANSYRISSISTKSYSDHNSMSFSPVTLSVSQGDKIRLLIYVAASGATVRGQNAVTYISVKQVG